MRRLLGALTCGVLALPGLAVAQEDLRIDRDKVYVTDAKACDALEARGVDAWMDLDFLSLTFADGIQSMEFHCPFFDVKAREESSTLLVEAVCELPGEFYPDLLAVAPAGDDTIQVVSASDVTLAHIGKLQAEPDSPFPAGTTIYHRCDNLSEIPVD